LVCACLLLFSTTAAWAGPFERNRGRLSLHAGTASAFDENYVVVGGGGGYFPLDGLELGVDGEAWLGGHPKIYKLSPQVRYVLTNGASAIHPYVGAFYRRSWFENLDDLNSVGGRVGFHSALGSNVYTGAGVVYESYLDCDEKVYEDCSFWAPEITVSLGF